MIAPSRYGTMAAVVAATDDPRPVRPLGDLVAFVAVLPKGVGVEIAPGERIELWETGDHRLEVVPRAPVGFWKDLLPLPVAAVRYRLADDRAGWGTANQEAAHIFGEEGGTLPVLVSEAGQLKFKGGSYWVGPEGIRN